METEKTCEIDFEEICLPLVIKSVEKFMIKKDQCRNEFLHEYEVNLSILYIHYNQPQFEIESVQ